jgi:hypothetical protein
MYIPTEMCKIHNKIHGLAKPYTVIFVQLRGMVAFLFRLSCFAVSFTGEHIKAILLHAIIIIINSDINTCTV